MLSFVHTRFSTLGLTRVVRGALLRLFAPWLHCWRVNGSTAREPFCCIRLFLLHFCCNRFVAIEPFCCIFVATVLLQSLSTPSTRLDRPQVPFYKSLVRPERGSSNRTQPTRTEPSLPSNRTQPNRTQPTKSNPAYQLWRHLPNLLYQLIIILNVVHLEFLVV